MSVYINNRKCGDLYKIENYCSYNYDVENFTDSDFNKLTNLKGIKPYAFITNKKLKHITTPESVTYIGDYAFSSSYLESVDLSKSTKLTKICSHVFSGCSNLSNIKLPQNLSYIESYAFNNCSKLNSITIGSGLIKIYDYAFYMINNLTNVYYNGTIDQWVSISITDNSSSPLRSSSSKLYINGILQRDIEINVPVKQYAFGLCGNLNSIILNKNVTSIGQYAFRYCENLTKLVVNVPADIEITIGNYAFPTSFKSHLDVYTDNQSIITALSSATNVTFYHLDRTPWETT